MQLKYLNEDVLVLLFSVSPAQIFDQKGFDLLSGSLTSPKTGRRRIMFGVFSSVLSTASKIFLNTRWLSLLLLQLKYSSKRVYPTFQDY
jgi:hypothetical protein